MESEEKASGKITKYIGSDKLEIVPLGGGNEVGRSCIMLKFKGKLIMVGQKLTKSSIVEFIQHLMTSLRSHFLT
jgi:predicted metal-dependent RNase